MGRLIALLAMLAALAPALAASETSKTEPLDCECTCIALQILDELRQKLQKGEDLPEASRAEYEQLSACEARCAPHWKACRRP